MHGSRISTSARRGLAAVVAAGSLLTVLTTATPASAGSASTPVGGSKVVCTSKKPGLAPALSQDIADALHGREGASALAVYDRRTRTHCEFKAGTHFDSASVVKVTVLAALLRQAEEAHRKLTPHEKRLATAMITKSDNKATTALWRRVGPAGIKHFLSLAGMRHTVPGTHGAWGLTQITAADQLTLMQLLTTDNRVLTAASRGYALDLMHRVVPDQRWGVPAGAPDPDAVHVKNGWLPRKADGWRVNSVGTFNGSGNDYGMAVLSTGNHTMDDGVATVERAARVIHRDLTH
ncbi:class A beta-lactamase-related serine hydrolase [Streptomyces sp. Isolate_219]|uniref:class A beta-lactamase-related serine hydrolase n=1 Tax=Streptomyces sp. Isolate_219 TaxID=2950110 RepID=UPI0021CA5048|nr:class A beta-lactamase-related serine hydrolase [Streptomyces sp. Isolate_219]MCR8576392.1 class A beta-lactamase-related serine hydrolase [Streptomyces sp. Isolate_219]